MPAYQVTDAAGLWVAGARAKPGQVLQLTEKQAEHELRRGAIVRADPEEASQPDETGTVEEATAQLAKNTAKLARAVKGGG